jgi:hypothetical protein
MTIPAPVNRYFKTVLETEHVVNQCDGSYKATIASTLKFA